MSRKGWCNVYRLFSSETVWPRGLPLDRVLDQRSPTAATGAVGGRDCPDSAGPWPTTTLTWTPSFA